MDMTKYFNADVTGARDEAQKREKEAKQLRKSELKFYEIIDKNLDLIEKYIREKKMEIAMEKARNNSNVGDAGSSVDGSAATTHDGM